MDPSTREHLAETIRRDPAIPNADLAARFGVDSRSVRRLRCSLGIKSPPRPKPKPKPKPPKPVDRLVYPDPAKMPRRCPICGVLVYPPCFGCQVRRLPPNETAAEQPGRWQP